MDDYLSSARTFEDIFQFLYKTYFLQVAFGPVYLTERKTFAFHDELDILSFQETNEELRPSTKHQDKVKNWSTPRNREELDVFLWLTFCLCIFIPGRTDHVMFFKKAYFKKVPVIIKIKEPHNDELEKCDLHLAKIQSPDGISKEPTIRRT